MNGEDVQALVLMFIVFSIIGLSGYGVYNMFSGDRDDSMQFVSGTEYYPGDAGEVAVMVTDYQGNPVTASYACNYTVYYPNKTIFVQANMTGLTSEGTRYGTFTVPGDYGVYEYVATCTSGPKKVTAAKSFHVGTATDTLLNETKRSVSFIATGTSEVRQGTWAKNEWKIVSEYLTNISSVACRVDPIDSGTILSFSDDFNRANGPTGNGWSQTKYAAGTMLTFDSLVSGNRLLQQLRELAAQYSWVVEDRNLTFFPGKFYGTIQAVENSNPGSDFAVGYYGFFYYNATGGLVGKVYLDAKSSIGFNNCGGNPIPDGGDSCGVSDCANANVVCVEQSYVGFGLKEFDVDIDELARTKFTPDPNGHVLMRIGSQNRGLGTKVQIAFDNVNVLATINGTEYYDVANQRFGFTWDASRDVVESGHNYQVTCGAMYDVLGSRDTQDVRQFVLVNVPKRISAVVVK